MWYDPKYIISKGIIIYIRTEAIIYSLNGGTISPWKLLSCRINTTNIPLLLVQQLWKDIRTNGDNTSFEKNE